MEGMKNLECSLWKELDSEGFCVVDGVIPEEQCRDLRDSIVRKMVEAGWQNPVSGKWEAPPSIHGIYQDYGVGHLEEVWAVRKACKKMFASLWGTEDLLCSFDGLSFLPVGVRWPNVTAAWYHIDQGSSKKGLRCIQGLLTLNEMQDTDATFSIFPGTHSHHEQFRELFGKSVEQAGDFVPIGKNWPYPVCANIWDFYNQKGHTPKRIKANAGSMILWDSRCVHSNLPPVRSPSENERLVVYVCMLPKSLCSEEHLGEKVDLFDRGGMSSHWPYPVTPFKVSEKTENLQKKVLPSELNRLKNDREVCSLAGIS
ncbi:hypothetical protein BSKO_12760 [Bryopsis sp. KO-2023]|nr:hypothetical protein BSKO_12760 [Bryopsis sp. KO-2023]